MWQAENWENRVWKIIWRKRRRENEMGPPERRGDGGKMGGKQMDQLRGEMRGTEKLFSWMKR